MIILTSTLGNYLYFQFIYISFSSSAIVNYPLLIVNHFYTPKSTTTFAEVGTAWQLNTKFCATSLSSSA
jgi:hypothetical protein